MFAFSTSCSTITMFGSRQTSFGFISSFPKARISERNPSLKTLQEGSMTPFVRRFTLVSLLFFVVSIAVGQDATKPAAKPASTGQPAPKNSANPAQKSGGFDIPIPDIKYPKFKLQNGLTVIVHEDHKAPIVAVNTWYHVGSKNEKPGKTGFAHLFEHLMFGGSENFKGRYIDTMEKIGATDLNGTTNPDRTNYFQNVPTSALDLTLWMESDRMGHLLGTPDQKAL